MLGGPGPKTVERMLKAGARKDTQPRASSVDNITGDGGDYAKNKRAAREAYRQRSLHFKRRMRAGAIKAGIIGLLIGVCFMCVVVRRWRCLYIKIPPAKQVAF